MNTSLELLPGGCIRKQQDVVTEILTSGKEDGDTVIIRMKSLGICSGESGWNREESSLTYSKTMRQGCCALKRAMREGEAFDAQVFGRNLSLLKIAFGNLCI